MIYFILFCYIYYLLYRTYAYQGWVLDPDSEKKEVDQL